MTNLFEFRNRFLQVTLHLSDTSWVTCIFLIPSFVAQLCSLIF